MRSQRLRWDSVGLIIAREFWTRVRERTFRNTTALIMVIGMAAIALPHFLGSSSFSIGAVGAHAHQVVLSAKERARLAKTTVKVAEFRDERSAIEATERGDVDAVVLADGSILTRRSVPDQLRPFLINALGQAAVQERLTAARADPALLSIPTPTIRALHGGGDADRQRQAIAFAGMLLLMGQLVTYGSQVAYGVVEEKSSRVVEVVLAGVRPRELFFGKILGVGLVGLLQLAIVAASTLSFAVRRNVISLTAPNLVSVAQVGLWFILAFAFFSAMYAAAAATTSRAEDLPQVLAPLNALATATFIAGFYASQHPAALATSVLSYLPPLSPVVMTTRWAAGDAASWQVALSAFVMAAATLLVTRLGAHIYAAVVLRMGAPLRPRDILHAYLRRLRPAMS